MTPAPLSLDDRFFETTRGRVVALLRRASQTVDELAARLGLTDNAVRMHLAALDRDGVVREEGVRRGAGAGKPATIYGIAPEALPAFSRGYVPVLRTLLAALADEMPRARLRRLLRDAGRRLAATVPSRSRPRDPRARVALAVAVLEELGGVATVTEQHCEFRIRGAGCPLSAVVAERPEVCAAVAAMLGEIVDGRVRECCEHGPEPRCGFAVAV